MTVSPQVASPQTNDCRSSRGAAAATTVALTTIAAVLVILLVVVAGRIVLTVQQAQTTADVTALAVMSGSRAVGGSGIPAVDAGQLLAQRSGMTLQSVDVAGWPDSVVVTITTTIDVAGISVRRAVSAGATVQPARR